MQIEQPPTKRAASPPPKTKTTKTEKKTAGGKQPAATQARQKEVKSTGRRKKRVEKWSVYIYKVMKQVHPEVGISERAMSIMNSFVTYGLDKLLTEMRYIMKTSGKSTLNSNDVQTATRLMLPGELAKHGVSEGNKAVGKFVTSA